MGEWSLGPGRGRRAQLRWEGSGETVGPDRLGAGFQGRAPGGGIESREGMEPEVGNLTKDLGDDGTVEAAADSVACRVFCGSTFTVGEVEERTAPQQFFSGGVKPVGPTLMVASPIVMAAKSGSPAVMAAKPASPAIMAAKPAFTAASPEPSSKITTSSELACKMMWSKYKCLISSLADTHLMSTCRAGVPRVQNPKVPEVDDPETPA
ncbi:hypothetical protein E1301_Tti018740 [Triplophysa tibetana]|uniref:Uncharacterized protein n=1 Tax=Triplophysa tibetana TaxID=1572043 RepID=A0A5A9PKC7_9TELE|nr:hypothetical protein E1301_Tti018740 [Triplophysa tibetana]